MQQHYWQNICKEPERGARQPHLPVPEQAGAGEAAQEQISEMGTPRVGCVHPSLWERTPSDLFPRCH